MPVDNVLAFASVRTLGKKLRAKEFSAVELAEFFLKRLEAFGPRFNAVVTVTRELALDEAARADRELAAGNDRGPLHGIPYGAKDLFAMRGIPTTWGAAPFKNRVLDEEATVIRKLRDAGAVLAAKLAMVEIAGGLGYRQANAAFTGPGLNPWDVDSWSGGSSSGSASAVAAGLVPFSVGTETWGSILNPASACGITGLRPTYGRVSRQGAMALSWTMDKIGPLARTAEDCGLVLQSLAGPDPQDPSASNLPFVFPAEQPAQPPFKLAALKGAAAKVQPEIRANYEASLEVLKRFATLEEISLPDLPYSATASTILNAEMAAAFEDMLIAGDNWELTAPEDRVGLQAAEFIAAKDYIRAFRIRPKIQQALDVLFSKYDAVVTPTLATVAYPLSRDFAEYSKGFSGTLISGAGNVAGLPAITIPNGFGERKLPTGLQLVGRAFSELQLLAVAQAVQNATQWHDKHPEI